MTTKRKISLKTRMQAAVHCLKGHPVVFNLHVQSPKLDILNTETVNFMCCIFKNGIEINIGENK